MRERDMQPTPKRSDGRSALIVGLGGDIGTACMLILRACGLRVVRVAHVAAACERIPVAQPCLVVAPEAMKEESEETLADRVVAVGAAIVWVPAGIERSDLTTMLTQAAVIAMDRSSKR